MNVRQGENQASAGSDIAALLVSPSGGHHVVLREIFSDSSWTLYHSTDYSEALIFIRRMILPVVICERIPRDGNWKTFVETVTRRSRPPRLLVSSPSVDFEFLREVRRIGAYSVLPSPFDARVVSLQVQLAWHSWHRQWGNARSISLGAEGRPILTNLDSSAAQESAPE